MWGAIIGAGIGLIGNAISAKSQEKAQARQAEAQAKASQLDLGKLRREAEQNGFNPLTVLGATGGVGFNQDYIAPRGAGFLSYLAGGLGPAVTGAMDTIRQDRLAKIDSDLAKAQTGYYDSQTARANAGITRLGTLTANPGVPKVEKYTTYDAAGWTPVYSPSGMPMSVHTTIANQLDLKPGDIWMAEHDEAVLGDIGSTPNQATGAIDAAYQSVKGWLLGDDRSNSYVVRGHLGNPTAKQLPPGQPIPAPPPLSATPLMRNPNPQAGWMDKLYAN